MEAVAVDNGYAPSNLLLQWHITERCNLRCHHCYQDNYARDELPFDTLLTILEQFKTLLNTLRQRAGQFIRGHITVTGGEPFARQDFLDLLNIFAQYHEQFSFAILTNSTLIDATLAQQLALLKPAFIQVSIEGDEKIHDEIRGKGNFQQVVTAIKYLHHAKIPTYISFTAHRQNFQSFPKVAQLANKLKVEKVWADRLIPCGTGANAQGLTPDETKQFFELMYQTQQSSNWLKKTSPVSMQRALQFLIADGKPYDCKAGDSLITLQPNGDIYPCRRLPIRVGNILENTLLDIYDNCSLFHKLRNPEQINQGCEHCFYAKACRGGLKCLSYAVTGDPFQRDPGCWLKNS